MQTKIESIYSFHQMGERDNQEDSRYPDIDNPNTDNSVFVVCDGVGGCEKGEIASSTVCKHIGALLANHSKSDMFTIEKFKSVLNSSYSALDRVSDNSNKGMGTTLTFLCFHAGGVFAAHIGDSRIYQIRPKEGIIYRSEDHSLVNALLRSGNISPDEVKNHPKANIITRCMSANDGTRDKDEATVVNLRDIATGDYFLLCTDGVTNTVDDEELIDLYSTEKSDKEKYDWLSRRCLSSSDNNTVIQIHIGLVTIDAERQAIDDSFESISNNTLELKHKDDAVCNISATYNNRISKLKTFFKDLFK